MLNEYVKKIIFKYVEDANSVRDIQASLEELTKEQSLDIDTSKAMKDIKSMTDDIRESMSSVNLHVDSSNFQDMLSTLSELDKNSKLVDLSTLEKTLTSSQQISNAIRANMNEIDRLTDFTEQLLSLNTSDAHASLMLLQDRIMSLKDETEVLQNQQHVEEDRLKTAQMMKQLNNDMKKAGIDNNSLSESLLVNEKARENILEEIKAKELMISRLRGVGSKSASKEQARLEDEVASLKATLSGQKKSGAFAEAFKSNSNVASKLDSINLAGFKETTLRGAGKLSAKVLDDSINAVKTQLSSVFTAGTAQLKNMFLGSWDSLGDVFSSAFDELSDMISSSFLTNDTTWNNLTTYGFDASQSYGFEQAKAMMGVTDESLERMNDSQRQMFNELFKKYQGKYADLYDSGFFDQMMKFNIESKEFQQDLKLEVVQFLMNNKDTIQAVLKNMLLMAEKVIDIASFLLGTKQNKAISAMSDATQAMFSDISNVTNNSINNTTSVKVDKIDNTFNATHVDSNDIVRASAEVWSQIGFVIQS